jgi:hypothetical protein
MLLATIASEQSLVFQVSPNVECLPFPLGDWSIF